MTTIALGTIIERHGPAIGPASSIDYTVAYQHAGRTIRARMAPLDSSRPGDVDIEALRPGAAVLVAIIGQRGYLIAHEREARREDCG